MKPRPRPTSSHHERFPASSPQRRAAGRDPRLPPQSPPRPPPTSTEKLYGLRAGLSIFTRRRDDIVRIVWGSGMRGELEVLLGWARERSIPQLEGNDDVLSQEADSKHHEGLCLEVRTRRWTPAAELGAVLQRGRGLGVALDRVRNPYNVGAVLRSAAFFGFDAALLGAPAPHPALHPDAVRVAEGGAEALALSRTTDLADTLGRLRALGIRIVGAESEGGMSFRELPISRPTLLVVGHEREGLSERVRAKCDALVRISGSGQLGSLNVAVAAGILMAQADAKSQ